MLTVPEIVLLCLEISVRCYSNVQYLPLNSLYVGFAYKTVFGGLKWGFLLFFFVVVVGFFVLFFFLDVENWSIRCYPCMNISCVCLTHTKLCETVLAPWKRAGLIHP